MMHFSQTNPKKKLNERYFKCIFLLPILKSDL